MSAKSFALSVVIGAMLGRGYLNTFDTAEQKAAKLGKAYDENNRKLATANAVIKYRAKLQALKAKQAELGTSNKRLNAGIADLEKRYRRAKREAKAYGMEILSIEKSQKKLARQNAILARQMQAKEGRDRAAGRLSSLRGAALGMTGVGMALGGSIGGAYSVDDAATRLADVVDQKNIEEAVAKARKHASAFARDSLANQTEMLDIKYALNSAGIQKDAAKFGSEIVHKVAKVTTGSSERVGEVIGGVFNNFGDSLEGNTADRMERIGDILTKTQFQYQIRDFSQLGESFSEGAKGAIKYNVPLDQTASILGQLNSSMVTGSSAGTAMNAILRQMGKASEEFGFEIVRNNKGQMDMIGTLSNLRESLSIFDDPDEKAAAIQKAFGDEGGSVTLLLEKMDSLKEGFKGVRDGSRGVVDQSYERHLKSSANLWRRTTKNVSQLGATFGTTLLPGVNAVLRPMIKLTGWAADAMEKYPVIGRIIGGLAGGMMAMGTAIGIVTAAQWLWNVALMANPIGLIIGAVVGLGVALYALYENWDEIWAAMMAMVEPFTDMLSGIWSWLSGDDEADKAKVKAQPGRQKNAIHAIQNAKTPAALSNQLAPSSAVQNVQHKTNNNTKFEIYQQPGQDPEQLADEVIRKMNRKQRRAMHD